MAQFGHGDGRRKKSKTGEDGRNQTVQAGHENGQRKKARLEKLVATTAQVGPGDRGRKKIKKEWI